MKHLVKEILPKSLLGRSLIILILPLLIVQLVLGYVYFERHTETVLRTLSETIAGDISFLSSWYDQHQSFEQLKQLDQSFGISVKVEKQHDLQATGALKNTWLYGFMEDGLSAVLGYPFFLRIDRQKIYISVQIGRDVVEFSTSRKRLFSKTTPLVMLWTTLSGFLLFIVSSIFMRNQIRPIKRLAYAAEQFGKGDNSIDFQPEGATEVRKAGFAFLMMRDRVKRMLNERMEMLAGVSHDLRTPLTRLKIQASMLENETERLSLLEDIADMQEMVEGYLMFARGIVHEESQYLNIHEIIKKTVLRHGKDGFPITMELDQDIKLMVKVNTFNRILTNVILNSIRYGKKLHISLRQVLHHIEIVFDDDGPGIPEGERENVFKPFYRVDRARGAATGGVGLGLSIVRDGVRGHGGRVYLKTSPWGGLRLVLKFPV